jgi:hypothetical protein
LEKQKKKEEIWKKQRWKKKQKSKKKKRGMHHNTLGVGEQWNSTSDFIFEFNNKFNNSITTWLKSEGLLGQHTQ